MKPIYLYNKGDKSIGYFINILVLALEELIFWNRNKIDVYIYNFLFDIYDCLSQFTRTSTNLRGVLSNYFAILNV